MFFGINWKIVKKMTKNFTKRKFSYFELIIIFYSETRKVRLQTQKIGILLSKLQWHKT